MNVTTVINVLGKIALVCAILLLIPFFIAIFGAEQGTPLAFGITILSLGLLGGASLFVKVKGAINVRSGFVAVALGWLLMSAFGALPFFLSGQVPSYTDCFFETVSGFTTTGASILPNIEALSPSLLFWRSFTHWIGGMGVIVLVVALLPKSGKDMVHLLKAEIPGPTFGKLVSKTRFTARILYAIYLALTALEVILLMFGKMSFFDSLIHTFSTAGTGGFSNYNLSVGFYNSVYIEVVITVFMVIFSINFNLFFFLLLGHAKEVLKSEELHWLLGILCCAILAITLSLTINKVYDNFWQSLRYASFQAASMMSTTGFATADYTTWPSFTHVVLVLLMFIGGSAGSTAGGIKVSRLVILVKTGINNVRRTINTRTVFSTTLDGQPVSAQLSSSVCSYFALYIGIFFLSVVAISAFSPQQMSFETHFSAVAACINNVGPGLESLGPLGNYSNYSIFSKLVLSANMLLGRLEVMPLLLLFYPKVWKK